MAKKILAIKKDCQRKKIGDIVIAGELANIIAGRTALSIDEVAMVFEEFKESLTNLHIGGK
jgi:hypothetical protein